MSFIYYLQHKYFVDGLYSNSYCFVFACHLFLFFWKSLICPIYIIKRAWYSLTFCIISTGVAYLYLCRLQVLEKYPVLIHKLSHVVCRNLSYPLQKIVFNLSQWHPSHFEKQYKTLPYMECNKFSIHIMPSYVSLWKVMGPCTTTLLLW